MKIQVNQIKLYLKIKLGKVMKHILKNYFDLNKIYLRQINILIILKL